jgi:outer membrane lipoprotein-sorting protein
MISGRLAVSGLLLLCTAASAAGPDVARILTAVASASAGETAFIERRTLSLLDQVVEVRGSLRFTRPARLEKRVTAPYAEQVVVDGRQLTITRPGRPPAHLSLDDAPLLDAFIGSFRATLAGDGAELADHYSITAEGSEAAWTLRLKPTAPALARVVESIAVDGEGGRITRFAIRERGGDHTVLDLGP